MRILLINVLCKSGSTGKITYDLYDEYKKQGHEVKICYGRGNVMDNSDTYKFTTKPEFYLHTLSTRLTGYVGKGSYFATKRLIRYIKNFAPDVVHLHNIHGYYVDAYMLLGYLKGSGVRVVFTMHDEWIFTGKCGYAYDCERWRIGCGKCPQLSEYPKSWLFDRTAWEYKRKSEIFAELESLVIAPVSNWLKERAERSLYLSDKRFKTVYNGVDIQIFTPSSHEHIKDTWIIPDEKILLHVTPNFYDPRKGGQYILELAERLLDLNVKIIIVGATLHASAPPKNIIAIGRTENQTELATFYSLADITLLTSEKETFSMICAESLCCGTPIVGFEAGAPSEVVPVPYGYFVPFGDIDRLEECVRSALAGEIVLADSQKCENFGKSRYAKQVMAENYFEIYCGEV